MEYKLVVFDMDGTFINSRNFHAQLFYEFFRKYWKPISYEQCYEAVGITVRQVFEEAEIPLKDHAKYYDLLDDFYNYESKELIKLTSVPEKFRDVLDLLRKKKIKTAVVTNSLHCVVKKIMEYHSLDTLFDEIVGADRESKDKISRCRKLLDKYDVCKEEVLFVGDTESDMELAFKMGFGSCFAKTEIAWYKDSAYILQNFKPTMVTKDYEQMLRMLEGRI